LQQQTQELDYNISASGMKAALESLSTINQVNVNRELFCSSEAGQNNCGYERGYIWMITFLDVIDNGLQSEPYVDTYETNFNHRLSVTGQYLRACDHTGYHCYTNGTAVAFVDSYAEVQTVCLCDASNTAVSYMGSTTTIGSGSTSTKVKTALEAITGVGHVTVASTSMVSGSCGCSGTAKSYRVTFDTFVGDAPQIVVSPGTSVEAVKGFSQMVSGISDYSLDIKRRTLFTTGAKVYLRVAAVNSVGTSSFVTPFEYPVVLYEGPPLPPVNVQAVSNTKTSLLVTWSRLSTSLNITGLFPWTHFDIEYDTSPAFASWCSTPICRPLTTYPLHTVWTNASQQSSIITNLVPGQEYYVRVKACRNTTSSDMMCSPYSHVGFPNSPISATPMGVPSQVNAANITMLNSTSFAIDWNAPNFRSEGSNGAPIDSYTINVATPVQEVQQLEFDDPTGAFNETIRLQLGASITRCFSVSASEAEMKLKIEELNYVESVSVAFQKALSTATSRIYWVTFLDFDYEGGGSVIPELVFNSVC